MTSEATINQINELEYRQVTVADGSAFAKGTIMYFEAADGTVNHYANGQNRKPAGVLAVEKVASDGQTTVPVVVRGTVTLPVADLNVTVGASVVPASIDNSVRGFGAASLEITDMRMGFAETGANIGSTIRVRLMLG
jgi:hypothetical protein